MPTHVTQWCYSDDAALPWWFWVCVCVSCCRVKHKNDPAITANCGCRICENVLALLPVKEQQSVSEQAETITELFVLIK